jgi:type II secretory pathway pseudopilin PulG
MKKKNAGYALIEIILSIGVLAIVSMTVVQMFALAANVQKRARDTDVGARHAQSVIETYRVTKQVPPPITYYDESWNPSSEDDASYQVLVTLSGTDLETIEVTVERYGANATTSVSGQRHDPLIFTLSTKIWRGGTISE